VTGRAKGHLRRISTAKSDALQADDFSAPGSSAASEFSFVFRRHADALAAAGALDFSDLIARSIEVLLASRSRRESTCNATLGSEPASLSDNYAGGNNSQHKGVHGVHKALGKFRCVFSRLNLCCGYSRLNLHVRFVLGMF
jgi:hypothetical protein